MYFRTCPRCGANLDPGEICECRRQHEKEAASVTPETAQENGITNDKTTRTVTYSVSCCQELISKHLINF